MKARPIPCEAGRMRLLGAAAGERSTTSLRLSSTCLPTLQRYTAVSIKETGVEWILFSFRQSVLFHSVTDSNDTNYLAGFQSVLWIRIRIGSVFRSLVDPDPYSEFRLN